jgi:hypothetical protein
MAIAHDHDHVMTMRSVVILNEQSSWYGNNCYQEDYIMNSNTIYIEPLTMAQSTLLIDIERLVERIKQTDPRQLHTLFQYITPKLKAYWLCIALAMITVSICKPFGMAVSKRVYCMAKIG